MLYGEKVAVYVEDYREHINTLCGQNADIFNAKTGATYINYKLSHPSNSTKQMFTGYIELSS
jgi:hypothetical protein